MNREVTLCRNRLDGITIPVFQRGRGEVVLLVHGWTLDSRSFAGQRPLADHFRLVAFDRRGCGRSTATPDLGAETSDIDAIIDMLSVDRVHLLGVSQGARVALRFAAERPARLHSLILQGPAVDGFVPPIEDTTGIPLQEYAELVEKGQIETLRERWLKHPLMSSESLCPEQSAALQDMVAGYQGQDLLAGAPAASAIPNLLETLGSLDLPTLIVTGERETAARRAHCEILLEVMRDARETVLPDCGHLSNFSRPEAYNEVVQDFLLSLATRH